MKAKIAITVSVLLLGTITTANADLYIQSPSGLTQSQWNATDSYKNFSCPAGYMRSEGVDMNFTITNADDFYYAECLPQRQFPPVPIFYTEPNVNVTPLPTSTQTETSTATVTPSVTTPVSNNTATVISETTTAVTETATATSTSTTFESLYAQIMALFTQLLALIAKLKG
jgi:hypothetical protein